MSAAERKRTPSILVAENCECKNTAETPCTDKWIRCQARATWHFDRGWPDAPDPSAKEKAKRKKHGIVYNARGKRVHGVTNPPTARS